MEYAYYAILIASASLAVWAYGSQVTTITVPRLNMGKSSDVVINLGSGQLSIRHYKAIRLIAVMAILAYVGYSFLTTGKISQIACAVLLVIIVFTDPTAKISIIAVLSKRFQGRVRAMQDQEIYRAIIQLVNIASLDLKMSATEVMTELLRHTSYLRPELARLIRLWYSSDKVVITADFAQKIGTDQAKYLAKILLKLDSAYPSELRNELELYQITVLAEKQTTRENKDAAIGDLFNALVTALFMVILVNFIVVVVYANTSFNLIR